MNGIASFHIILSIRYKAMVVLFLILQGFRNRGGYYLSLRVQLESVTSYFVSGLMFKRLLREEVLIGIDLLVWKV